MSVVVSSAIAIESTSLRTFATNKTEQYRNVELLNKYLQLVSTFTSIKLYNKLMPAFTKCKQFEQQSK